MTFEKKITRNQVSSSRPHTEVGGSVNHPHAQSKCILTAGTGAVDKMSFLMLQKLLAIYLLCGKHINAKTCTVFFYNGYPGILIMVHEMIPT